MKLDVKVFLFSWYFSYIYEINVIVFMHLYIEVGVEIYDQKHTIVKHRSKAVMGTGIYFVQ